NEKIISAMTNLASHSTSNPTTPAQYAAIAAYAGPEEPVLEMKAAFEKRLDTIYEQLIQIPGFSCAKPQGAFYLYPNVRIAAERTGYETVDTFAQSLLEEANLAIVPDSGFCTPDNIRLSYATTVELLEEAMRRIKRFLEEKMNN